ncbi:MAG: hypothetical protein AAF354_07375 [Pseudomonadota bacterium]
MIEMRWRVNPLNYERELQYRYLEPSVDASGGFCPPGEWSAWEDVPEFEGDLEIEKP